MDIERLLGFRLFPYVFPAAEIMLKKGAYLLMQTRHMGLTTILMIYIILRTRMACKNNKIMNILYISDQCIAETFETLKKLLMCDREYYSVLDFRLFNQVGHIRISKYIKIGVCNSRSFKKQFGIGCTDVILDGFDFYGIPTALEINMNNLIKNIAICGSVVLGTAMNEYSYFDNVTVNADGTVSLVENDLLGYEDNMG
jgi:hypothetical protein